VFTTKRKKYSHIFLSVVDFSMAKVSARVRSFRSRARSGAIMSRKTFNAIARSYPSKARGLKAAGAAYWAAAKRRAAGKRKGS
jgi:hypothetical protein